MNDDLARFFEQLSGPGPLCADTLPTALAEPHHLFCEEFSRYVVRRFLAGEITFWPANRAMNRLYLYSYHAGVDRGMPKLAWLVFEAFEQGEIRHGNDDDSVDSVDKYVRPSLLELLAASV